MPDTFEQLCDELVRVLTRDNVELVERYFALKNNQPKQDIGPQPPKQEAEKHPTKEIINQSTAGASTSVNIGAAVKRADLSGINQPAPPPEEEQDLF